MYMNASTKILTSCLLADIFLMSILKTLVWKTIVVARFVILLFPPDVSSVTPEFM